MKAFMRSGLLVLACGLAGPAVLGALQRDADEALGPSVGARTARWSRSTARRPDTAAGTGSDAPVGRDPRAGLVATRATVAGIGLVRWPAHVGGAVSQRPVQARPRPGHAHRQDSVRDTARAARPLLAAHGEREAPLRRRRSVRELDDEGRGGRDHLERLARESSGALPDTQPRQRGGQLRQAPGERTASPLDLEHHALLLVVPPDHPVG